MATDIQMFSRAGVPSVADFKRGVQAAQAQAPANTAGVQFLKMQQIGSPHAGELTFGAEHTQVEDGSEWVVNTLGIEHGYLLRDGGSVNGERYAPITEPLPTNLPPAPRNSEWRQSYKCQLVCISGQDKGTTVEYAGDAGGVIKLFKNVLLPSISEQLDVDPSHMFPVLTWEVTSYYSTKQKKDIWEAHGTVVRWMSNDDIAEAVNGKGTPEPKPAPAAAVAPTPDAPPPAAARRRRAAPQ